MSELKHYYKQMEIMAAYSALMNLRHLLGRLFSR